MHVCPHCGSHNFLATAHITQTWLIDKNGEYISDASSCDDILHAPADDDLWTCNKCGFEAAGYDFKSPWLHAIVIVDKNWGIGKDGKQNVFISADLKRFKELTKDKTVVFGRKTMETFPNGKPLKNRKNIILSKTLKNEDFEGDVRVCPDIKSVLKNLPDGSVVIGGASVYSAFMPYCASVYVTQVDAEYQNDSFFPKMDTMDDWYCSDTSDWFEENGIRYRYLHYSRY